MGERAVRAASADEAASFEPRHCGVKRDRARPSDHPVWLVSIPEPKVRAEVTACLTGLLELGVLLVSEHRSGQRMGGRGALRQRDAVLLETAAERLVLRPELCTLLVAQHRPIGEEVTARLPCSLERGALLVGEHGTRPAEPGGGSLRQGHAVPLQAVAERRELLGELRSLLIREHRVLGCERGTRQPDGDEEHDAGGQSS